MNFSYSFQWIILKSCILVVDILKMCIWIFADKRIIFDKITAYLTENNFEVSVQHRVASLCNQLLQGL